MNILARENYTNDGKDPGSAPGTNGGQSPQLRRRRPERNGEGRRRRRRMLMKSELVSKEPTGQGHDDALSFEVMLH
jgi:hypothetical protein